ncbi:MAG: GNAT family N-acetyltransferase [Bacteroidota bacterium]
MTLRPFRRSDFSTYQQWYDDAQMNDALGPVDNAWLEYVLSENEGKQFSMLQQEELLGVAGIIWPTQLYPVHYITDLAIAPSHQGKGYGRLLIELLSKQSRPSSNVWKAFVMRNNPAGKAFFLALDWHLLDPKDSKEMLEFTSIV